MATGPSQNSAAPATQPPGTNIEVWNDLVSPRDLLVALGLCAGATAGATLLAWLTHGSAFFWGLGGAVAGFVASTLLITPKRTVIDDADVTEHSATADTPSATRRAAS